MLKTHRIKRVLHERRHLLAAVMALLALVGGAVGYFTYRYSASVTLLRTENDPESQLPANMAALLQERLSDPKVLEAAAKEEGLSIQLGELQSAVSVKAISTSPASLEIITRAAEPFQSVALVNSLAKQALTILSDLTAVSGKTMVPLYREKLLEAEKQLKVCGERLLAFEKEMGSGDHAQNLEEFSKRRDELETRLSENESLARTLALQVKNLQQEIVAHHPAVLSAKQALDKALLRYTEDHPKVQELKLTLEAVQTRVREGQDEVDPDIALNGTSLAQGLYSKLMALRGEEKVLDARKQELLASLASLAQRTQSFPEMQIRYARLKSDYQVWNRTHQQLLQEMSQQQLLAATARMPFKLQQTSDSPQASQAHRWSYALCLGLACSALGGASLGGSFAWRACRDPRIRSEAELLSAASLPVLGKLPNLHTMTVEEQEKWAFSSFNRLKATLAPANGAALICGFTSSRRGEGRSTWIRLLAGTARKQGYQVLVLAAVPDGSAGLEPSEQPAYARDGERPGLTIFGGEEFAGLTTESLSHPQTFAVPTQAAWGLQNRLQWQQGIQELSSVPNRVILVEFPPASEPEAVLLAQNFPNLVWVCGQDLATNAETQEHLAALRGSQVRFAGAVLNFSQS